MNKNCTCDVQNAERLGHFRDCALVSRLQHTPTSMNMPLYLSNHPVSNEKVVLQDADGMRIAIFDLESEAAFIVRATNAHEEFREILVQLANWMQGEHTPNLHTLYDDELTWREKVTQALARAEQDLGVGSNPRSGEGK